MIFLKYFPVSYMPSNNIKPCELFSSSTGAGYGMAFIAANVIIGLYFTSKRALAVGIAMSGSGVGVLAYSYFAENMLNYYGWRSTVLLLAGIALHCVIFGSLSRPLKWKLKSQTKSLSNSNSNSSQETEELNGKFYFVIHSFPCFFFIIKMYRGRFCAFVRCFLLEQYVYLESI